MQNGECSGIENLQTINLENLSLSFSNELRKSDHPYVLPLREDNHKELEEHLFSGSYKGVTDLVTKFCWPVPAQWATRFCALTRDFTQPSDLLEFGVSLVILAGILFSYGYFVSGLVLGWVMTFLDTVDGKLARVTVTSSKWGNIFDHGIDLIHPPLWYLAWGVGLMSFSPLLSSMSLEMTCWVIVMGYILGRMLKESSNGGWEDLSFFVGNHLIPIFDLITARRNPNMIFLTGSGSDWTTGSRVGSRSCHLDCRFRPHPPWEDWLMAVTRKST